MLGVQCASQKRVGIQTKCVYVCVSARIKQRSHWMFNHKAIYNNEYIAAGWSFNSVLVIQSKWLMNKLIQLLLCFSVFVHIFVWLCVALQKIVISQMGSFLRVYLHRVRRQQQPQWGKGTDTQCVLTILRQCYLCHTCHNNHSFRLPNWIVKCEKWEKTRKTSAQTCT